MLCASKKHGKNVKAIKVLQRLHWRAKLKPGEKRILNIALPAVFEQLLLLMIGVYTTFFVGKLGNEYIGAVGFINTLLMFFQTIFNALAMGATVVASHMKGEGEEKHVGKMLNQSLLFSVGLSIAVIAIGYSLDETLIGFLVNSPDPLVPKYALEYFDATFFSLIFIVIDITVTAALRGVGNTRPTLYVSMVMNVLQILLCSTLINGVGGFIPAFGLKGAAISIVVVRAAGALIKLAFVLTGRFGLKLTLGFRFDLKMMRRVIVIGLPALVEQFFFQGGFLLISSIVSSLDSAAFAGYQIGGNINGILQVFVLGFQIAVVALIGESLGRKKRQLARYYLSRVTKISLIAMSVLSIILIALSRPVVGLFSSEADVIGYGLFYVILFAVTSPLAVLIILYSGALRAAGDVLYAMVTTLVGIWLFRIALTYVGQSYLGWGVYAVGIGISVDFTVRSFLYHRRIKKGDWLYLNL